MTQSLILLGVVLVVVVVAKQLARRLRNQPRGETAVSELSYDKKRYFFSKAEKAFYQVLLPVVPEDHVLFAKVRVADVLNVRSGSKKRQSLLNKISSKHFDFVVCDCKWLEPRLAIELDDASHGRPDRQARDAFLDGACEAAGLPLLHIRARSAYDQKVLAEAVRKNLSRGG